jgi:hypothetical protein
MPPRNNRYSRIVEKIFLDHYHKGDREVLFDRDEFRKTATELGINPPKNLGDIVYSFRYRNELPEIITRESPDGYDWIILPNGRSRYKLTLVKQAKFRPNPDYLQIKIPDSTPGIVSKYALDDEQALLTKIRYNRLIDIFTGITCYSLQNHLRTTTESGQLETDEIYVGLDKHGVHYVFPVQAKGGNDKIGIVQVIQDLMICEKVFPTLIVKPIAAQFMNDSSIALFEFTQDISDIRIVQERHFKLVPLSQLSIDELESYKKHLS